MAAPEANGRGDVQLACLLWLDIKPADPEGVALLRDVVQMHPLAIEAVTEFGQRPRVEDFGNAV